MADLFFGVLVWAGGLPQADLTLAHKEKGIRKAGANGYLPVMLADDTKGESHPYG